MELRIVSSRKDVSRFLSLPRSLYDRQSPWVEPLRREQGGLLDQLRHPFYAKRSRAQAEFFLVIDPSSDRVLGRIAAIHNHSQRMGNNGETKVGYFGFFESVNSQEVANKLLDASSDWLQRQGVEVMLGPANPSQNYEYGLLIQGFEQPHRFLLPYNPPYYQNLLSSYGLSKAKDLFVFSCDLTDDRMRQKIEHDAQRFVSLWQRRFSYIRVRPVDLSRLDQEVHLLVRLMHEVLINHWEYTPMSSEELDLTVRKLRPLINPNLVLIVERNDIPMGILLAIPDFNEVIRKLKIRHDLFELLELLVRVKLSHIKCARLIVLGVSQEQPTTFGLTPFLLLRLYQNLVAQRFTTLDAHWILEDNLPVLGIVRRYDLQADRVYRIYSGSLR